MLRTEEINGAGGIRGRPIELIVKDAEQFKDDPRKSIDELIQAGVIAIIGPVTSSTAIKVVPYANTKRLLMVSPSASTPALSNQDDFLFRTTLTTTESADATASYCYKKLGWRKIAGTFSAENRVFTEPWFTAFKKRFEKFGGSVIPGEILSENAKRAGVERSLMKGAPDGILIVSHALEVAKICQELRKLGSRYPIATSGIAYTPELIQHGGEVVEGIVFAVTFVEDEVFPGLQDFRTRYLKRYQKSPVLPDVYGYEAATILTEALKHSQEWTPEILKRTILTIKRFESPISPGGLVLNEYADVERNLIFMTVHNDKFVRIDDSIS
jgi:branched-chain amino acid transport system substrate-binding protein